MGGSVVCRTCGGRGPLTGVSSSSSAIWGLGLECRLLWLETSPYSVNEVASVVALLLISFASGLTKTSFCCCFLYDLGFSWGMVRVHVCAGACTNGCGCLWKPEVNLECHSSGTTRLVFWDSLIRLELTKRAGLCVQQAPGIHQVLPSQL